MSLLWRGRKAPERRMSYVAPPTPYAIEDGTYAQTAITTAESALQIIAVRSAVDLFASLASELPVDVFTGTGTSKQARPVPGYLEDPAGDGTGLPDWIYQVVESWLLRGNLYGDVLDRGRGGYPIQVLPLHPDCVGHTLIDGKSVWRVNGAEFDAERMFHRRVNPVPGAVLGLSPISAHAASLGVSLAATRFGYQWFREGGHPSALLSREDEGGEQLDEEGAKTAKARFMAALRGTREPLVMGGGWKYTPLQVAPEESQFLETQGFTAAECARIFGPGVAETLGYDSGGSMTYANVESRMNHLLILSLNRWISRVERLLSSMLPRPQYVRLNRDALLESTTLDRYRAHELALRNRWKTPNEVRALEDMQPAPWGDEPNQITAGATPGETKEDDQ